MKGFFGTPLFVFTFFIVDCGIRKHLQGACWRSGTLWVHDVRDLGGIRKIWEFQRQILVLRSHFYKILNSSWFFCEGTKAFKKKSAKHSGDYWDYEFFFWESSDPDRTVKALLLALLLEQGTPHCMEAQRCCLNKWQASQRSKAFKHVSFFFFSGIISRCNTFGAWRYFDNSKFWFCLFCIYRHILSMVFSLNCVFLLALHHQ